MRYLVTRNCYGFRNRYWEKDAIVEIDPAENPPPYFVPLDEGSDQNTVERQTPDAKKPQRRK